ncbi:MAG TPA: hypothetical protein VJU78_04340 [Chitinophagaceae bacterium]|nr:hypothetical protein [Chitinophagaceae bacterium]
MKYQLSRNYTLKGIYFLVTLMFVACDQPDSKNTPSKTMTADDSLKINLIGKWGGLGESIPVWNIMPDSIYYYGRSAAYPYQILNGDFIIYLPESKGVLKHITVIKDTMSFLDEQNNTIKGYRFTK